MVKFVRNLVVGLSILIWGCQTNKVDVPEIVITSVTINNAVAVNGMEQVPVNTEISISFSSSINTQNLATLVALTSNTGSQQLNFQFSNAGSKAITNVTLDFATSYTLTIQSGTLGANGEVLKSPLSIAFSTAEDDIIRELPPCSGSSACLQSVDIMGSTGSASISYYGNYPVFEEKAQWQKLKYAIIVVHGINRNADDYFNYMTSAVTRQGLLENTIILAPHYKEEATESDEFYWSGSGWRDGQNSSNSTKISSFQVVDTLVARLLVQENYPFLEKIIVTGHSSGGLFTNVYAAATQIESNAQTSIEYVIANSQYLYYPSAMRYNEDTQLFYEPAGCATATNWPMGYNAIPGFLGETSKTVFDNRFVNRKTTYLYGNSTAGDGTLNTTGCEATLLGSTRYQRGVNRFRFMNEFYPESHAHAFIEVNGVGHDGNAMYNSAEFGNYLEANLQ